MGMVEAFSAVFLLLYPYLIIIGIITCITKAGKAHHALRITRGRCDDPFTLFLISPTKWGRSETQLDDSEFNYHMAMNPDVGSIIVFLCLVAQMAIHLALFPLFLAIAYISKYIRI